MAGTFTVGKRVGLGFAFVLSIGTVAGGVSYFGFASIHSSAEIAIAANKLDAELAQKEIDHLVWASKVAAPFTETGAGDLAVETDDHKCGLGKWLYGDGRTQAEQLSAALAPLCKAIETPHAALHKSVLAIKTHLAGHTPEGLNQARQVYLTETRPSLAKIQDLLNNVRRQAQADVSLAESAMRTSAARSRIGLVSTAVLFLIAGGAVAVLIARGILRKLKQAISGLHESAGQVTDAAAQVSSAAQELARGASDQAASLEQTSSALEEMAAMTRTSAANAKQADDLAGNARKAASEGDNTTLQLNEAMAAINTSSEKISKIIKVIEEIAFQTNLLALNAAVEAARAGEHGKGFAVVADEVRNLAMRAAQAAKETSSLIEDSVERTRAGTQVASEVGKVLSGIAGDVTHVSELVNGISRASEEQAQGVGQLNTTVGHMDQLTQQNAANAEESAAAAEELTAQAKAVKDIVDELVALVHGKIVTANPAPVPAHRMPKLLRRTITRPGKPADAPPQPAASATPAATTAPSDFLALDENGLKDF